MTIAPKTRERGREVASDPITFAERFLRVQDKYKQTIPLRYKRAQLHYLEHRTKRDLILKARQLGFSTAIQAEHFRLATTGPEAFLTLADKFDNTDKLRRMQQFFYDHIPKGIQRPVRSTDNASVTIYPHVGSEINIGTAGSGTTGRGSALTGIHGSEVAWWRDASTVITGALQAVPEHGNTWVVFESTANGMSGWFFDECMRARDGDSEWTLHFYAWWWDDEYQLPLDPGEVLEYTQEEQQLVNQHGLTPEQIKWRRKKKKDLDPLHKFQQEYPESVEQAFSTSGDSVFDDFDTCLQAPVSPTPQEDHHYIGGVDWGQSDDYTALSIIDRTAGHEVVIKRWNKTDWYTMRKHILDECEKWCVRVLVAERNSASSNIEQLHKEARERDIKLTIHPFVMSNREKADLVTNFYTAIHDDEDRLLLLPVDYATSELRTYISTQTPTGLYKYEHAQGAHDDTVDARMLAWYGALHSKPRKIEGIRF